MSKGHHRLGSPAQWATAERLVVPFPKGPPASELTTRPVTQLSQALGRVVPKRQLGFASEVRSPLGEIDLRGLASTISSQMTVSVKTRV